MRSYKLFFKNKISENLKINLLLFFLNLFFVLQKNDLVTSSFTGIKQLALEVMSQNELNVSINLNRWINKLFSFILWWYMYLQTETHCTYFAVYVRFGETRNRSQKPGQYTNTRGHSAAHTCKRKIDVVLSGDSTQRDNSRVSDMCRYAAWIRSPVKLDGKMMYYRERIIPQCVINISFSSSMDHTQRVGFRCMRLYYNKYDTHTNTHPTHTTYTCIGPLYCNSCVK